MAIIAVIPFGVAGTAHADGDTVCASGGSAGEAALLGPALAGAAGERGGSRYGVALYDLTTGVTCDLDADRRMRTASIVKVAILATLLHRHEEEGTALTSDERYLATEMIEDSDNDAATALWHDDDGSAGVQEFMDAAGMRDTTAGPSGYWGLTLTTAADQVRLLTLLVTPNGLLDSASRAYMLGLMRSVTPEQAWGVTADTPSGVAVAVKNGWLDDGDGGWHINSLGVFTGGRHTYVMAVTTDDSPSEDYGIKTIETIASAVNARIQGTATAAPTAAPTPTPTPTPAPRPTPTLRAVPTARLRSDFAADLATSPARVHLTTTAVARPTAGHYGAEAAQWLLVLVAAALTWQIADRLLATRRSPL